MIVQSSDLDEKKEKQKRKKKRRDKKRKRKREELKRKISSASVRRRAESLESRRVDLLENRFTDDCLVGRSGRWSLGEGKSVARPPYGVRVGGGGGVKRGREEKEMRVL